MDENDESLVFVTIWDCRTHVPMTSSVERTDLDFKIFVALLWYINQSTSNAKILGCSCRNIIKILKNFGHPKNICNYHILLTMWFFHMVMGPKDADRIP